MDSHQEQASSDKRSLRPWLRALWLPLGVAVVAWPCCWYMADGPASADPILDVDLSLLALLAIASGWIVIRRGLARGERGAALAGALVPASQLLSAPLIEAAGRVLSGGLSAPGGSDALPTLAGVMRYIGVGFGLALPVGAVLGWIGGWLAAWTRRAAA